MKSRLLVVAVAAAVGALVVLLAAGQRWGSLGHTSVTGRQVSAALPALALALLALVVAAVAARGLLLRRLVAATGAVVAVVDVVVAVRSRHDIDKALAARAFAGFTGSVVSAVPRTNAWWVAAAAGGIVAAAAFSAIAIAGGRWRGMGAKYDAPQAATRQRDPDVAAWEALDRGDDPTA